MEDESVALAKMILLLFWFCLTADDNPGMPVVYVVPRKEMYGWFWFFVSSCKPSHDP